MLIFSSLLIVFASLASLVITVVAIFQILSNDFKGSKVLWIVISMIGIIGPILYLTEGRKRIIKKEYQNISTEQTFAFKKYYFELIVNLNIYIKVAFMLAITLIVLGYLLISFDIYFFWESKSIGYQLLFVLIAIFFRKDIIARKKISAKTTWSYIGFWIITFMLFVKLILMIVLPNSEAYEASKKYLKNDITLIKEIGEIKGYSILPDGGLSVSSDSIGSSGTATINLIIKGTKKYKEATLSLEKTQSTDWLVIGIE